MEALIAITGIIFGVGAPVLVIFLILLFSGRKTAKRLDTLVKVVEAGGKVEPEMLEMLNEPMGPDADLRKGLIWLAVGIPLTLGLMMTGDDAPWVFGLIPVFIGGAYLIVMKIALDKKEGKEKLG
ncbi:MAG: hypothetical protein KJN90_15135 [Gammaproteobacteria bacterium]|nr:hypothetical protein [Gammaproteobacteria bacterium]